MRRPLLAGLFALLVPGCLVGEIGSGGGVGDDDQGSGSDTGSNGSGNTTTPRLDAAIDKSSVSTELGRTENLVVTLTSVNGYTGTVSVTPSMMDGTTPLTGYTITPTPASVDMTANGTATVMVAVKVPTDTAVLAPSLKIDLGTTNVTSTFAVANQLTINIPSGTGTAAPHAGLPAINSPIRIRRGAMLIFHNADGIPHVIHADGGIPHENTALGLPNTDYKVTPTDSATWYCHDHEGGGSARSVLVQ